ncbi:MAG: extracellular solute-binding protein [Ignavibacteriaceae bacterium]
MNIEKILYIILSAILVAVFFLFILIFSHNEFDSPNKSNVKTIYFVDHISSAHQKVIDLFNKKNKNSIKVETINLSFDKFSTNERKELLARYLRSKNNRIDIFSVDQIWVPRFVRWGVSLNNLIDSSEIRDIIPNALKTCYYNDSLFAVPLYIDIAVMFYRDDLLKKLPDYSQIIKELQKSITWEEFIELHKKLKSSKNPFYIFQADDFEGLLCQFTELMANQNNPMIDKNKKLLINTPEGKKALQLLVDLVNKYGVSPKEVVYQKENESFRYFAKNDAVFVRGWSSMYDDENEFLTDEVRSHLKMAPLPHFKNTKPASVYGGWNLMVSKFSKQIPEVIKFAKFLLSEESQKIMYEEGGYLPINKKLYEDEIFVEKHKELKFFEELYKTGVHRPFLEDYTNVSDILSYYLHSAIKDNIPVANALENAESKIKEKSILVK